MQQVSMTVHVGQRERQRESSARCELALCLTWCERDPLTVELSLTATPPHPAMPTGNWAILRDFLHYGLTQPTGDGAVRVRPGSDPALVVIELPGWDGASLMLAAPAASVRAFIGCTHAVVPSGDVSEQSLDALIDRLLA
jgi:hypothetical protein